MGDTAYKVLGVLIPVLLGLLFRLVKVFSDREGDVLRTLVIRFTLPTMVFFSMYEAERADISAMPSMVPALVILTAALFPLGLLCSTTVRGTGRKSAVHACCTLGNYGTLGFGVARVLLGLPGLRRAVFFVTLWWPVFYAFGLPVGVIHARGRKGGVPVKKALQVALPVLLVMIGGLALNLGGLKVPAFLADTLRPFGEMTVPLILFSVGIMIDLKGVRKALAPALMVSAVTLVAAPLIGWAAACILTRDPVSQAVIILQAAMPVAATTPILAENFELDTDVAGTCIVVSTFLSLFTLPVVAYLAVP